MIMRQYKDISTIINLNEIFESASSCSGVRWLLSRDLWHKFASNPEMASVQIGNSISTSYDNSLEENLRL